MNVDRRFLSRYRGLWIGLVCLLCATGRLLSQDVQPIVVEMVTDSVVDPAALNFPNGPFGTCINGQTFQQEAVVSFKGYQYAGYFADGGVLCVARRQLPLGPWETIRFDDYSIDHNDVHNVVVIGICHADGTVHMAFDHHGHPLHYRRSVPQLALQPDAFEWTAGHFGKTVSALEPGKPLQPVTYPQFFNTPRRTLQLLYRLGASGNGDWHLAEYDPAGKGWSHVGMVLSRQGEYETSASRCAYPNPIRYGTDGRLHMTWCWRERPRGGPYDLRTNHDVCYAYSDDFGRTWWNNQGRVIAVLGGARQDVLAAISLDSPGIVVYPTRYLWGQMNTTTQFVDSRGRVHVINWQHQQDAATDSKDMNTWRYYHYWRDTDGRWHDNRLPFYGRKPQIVLDKAGTAFVVYCQGDDLNYHGRDPGGQLRIAAATEKTGWTDWKTAWESTERFVGEPLIDQGRWNDQEILSVYVQQEPKAPGVPSALHVRDFRMSQAKAAAAENNADQTTPSFSSRDSSQGQRSPTHFTFEKRGKLISRPAGMPKPGPFYTTLVKMNEIEGFPYNFALYFSTDHDHGKGGIWLYVCNGSPTEAANWKSYDQAVADGEFDYLADKPAANPVFVDAVQGRQTETPHANIIEGTVFMTYHNLGAGHNQSTLLATSKDGVNFARINGDRDSVILDYDPKREVGNGHTGYFRWRRNPFAGLDYKYVGYSLHGGGDDFFGALWASNDAIHWDKLQVFDSIEGYAVEADRIVRRRAIDPHSITALGDGQYVAICSIGPRSSGGRARRLELNEIYLADDGKTLTRESRKIVVNGPPGDYDEEELDGATSIVIGNTWHMIYVGTRGQAGENTIMAAVGRLDRTAAQSRPLSLDERARDLREK